MTWDQALAALVGIGITVLARLVNKWLPPAEYGLQTVGRSPREPMAGPPRTAPVEASPGPPPGYDAPTPPDDERRS